jgi:hypothetical protein
VKNNIVPCYKFAPGVYPNTFIFPTDNGWLYSVAFINNLSLFKGNAILENNKLSFEIVFNRSELDKAEKGKDALVASTISTILCQQFDLLGELPIYFFLCDMADKRGFARSQLFNQWYESSDLTDWELVNYELQDPSDDTVCYYAGLFINTQHPHYKLIPDSFERFLAEDVSTGKFVRRR